MCKRINTKAIVDGLKKTLKFVQDDFRYEYYEKNKLKSIRPTFSTFSLLGSDVEIVKVLNGGLVSDKYSTDATLKIKLYTYDDKVSSYSSVMDKGVSVFSSKSLFRSVKSMLLMEAENYGDSHNNSKNIDNGLHYLAPKKKNKDITKQPKVSKISNKLKKMLTSLSNDIWNINKVLHIEIDLSKTLNFEVYIDEDSELVQYRYIIAANVDLRFVNDNNKSIGLDIVEYLDGNNYEEFINKLRNKILSYIDRFREFHDLVSSSYPVLLKSSATNVLFHEGLIAHPLSLTLIMNEETTVFKDRIGELIPTLKGINLIMDPNANNGFGSHKYDQEGVPTKEVYLVRDGVIENYISDSNSASRYEQNEKDKELVKQLVLILSKNKNLLNKYVKKRFLKFVDFTKLDEQVSYLLTKYALTKLINNVDVDKNLDWRSDYRRLNNESTGSARVASWLDFDNEGNIIIVEPEARQSNYRLEHVNKKSQLSVKDKMIKLCENAKLDFYLEVEAFEGEVDVESGTFKLESEYITKVYLDGRRENINPGSFSMGLDDMLKRISYIGTENEINKGFCGSDSGFVPVQSDTPEMIMLDMPYTQGAVIDSATNEQIAVLQNK